MWWSSLRIVRTASFQASNSCGLPVRSLAWACRMSWLSWLRIPLVCTPGRTAHSLLTRAQRERLWRQHRRKCFPDLRPHARRLASHLSLRVWQSLDSGSQADVYSPLSGSPKWRSPFRFPQIRNPVRFPIWLQGAGVRRGMRPAGARTIRSESRTSLQVRGV